MPILGSFGTVNDRAFGFGDGSFKTVGNKIFVTSPITVEVLLVGGGGSGGITYSAPAGTYLAGGGGGGGQVLHVPSLTLEPTTLLTPYEAIVGAGGITPDYSSQRSPTGVNGESSTFAGLTAIGGGGGGAEYINGLNGASGGGAAVTLGLSDPKPLGGTGLYGGDGGDGSRRYDGNGNGGGGGGGAGGNGQDAAITISGNGGIGVIQTITGSSVYYAGGGGGGGLIGGVGGLGGGGNGDETSHHGAPNTGGGGGGGGSKSFGYYSQTWVGNGGSGVVIVKFLTSEASKVKVYNAIKTTDGLYTVCTFKDTYE